MGLREQRTAMLLIGGMGAMGAVAALMRSREASASRLPVDPLDFPLPPPPPSPEFEDEDYIPVPERPPVIPEVKPPRTQSPRTSKPQVPKGPPPRVETRRTAEPTVIGPPFQAGEEGHNAQLACSRGGLSHPNGRIKKNGQKLEDWYTDVAYWESYPGGPIEITKSAAHRPYAQAWLRIRGYVRRCLASATRKTKVPPPASRAAPASTSKLPTAQPPRSSTKRSPTPSPVSTSSSEPTTSERRTIGHPFRVGDKEHNARLACEQGGLSHPNGRIKKSGQSLEDWYTDVAYWETYPEAPQALTSSKAHRPYAKAWLEIRDLVRSHLKAKVSGVGAAIPSRKATPRRSPEPIPNQQPTVSGAGAEARNAALVLVARPAAVRHRGKVVRRSANQKLTDWLTYAAFWATYPEAPQKLDPKGGREHRNWLRAWVRIQGFVSRGLRLLPKLGQPPPLSFVPARFSATPHAVSNWQRWALALSFKSKVRTVAELREAYRHAATWLSTDARGLRFRNALGGRFVGGQRVTMDGLLGEVAQWFAQGGKASLLQGASGWPRKTLTKAFFATNGIWERREVGR